MLLTAKRSFSVSLLSLFPSSWLSLLSPNPSSAMPSRPDPVSPVEAAVDASEWATKDIWQLVPPAPHYQEIPEGHLINCISCLTVIIEFIDWTRRRLFPYIRTQVQADVAVETATSKFDLLLRKLRNKHLRRGGLSRREAVEILPGLRELTEKVMGKEECTSSNRSSTNTILLLPHNIHTLSVIDQSRSPGKAGQEEKRRLGVGVEVGVRDGEEGQGG
ncbi:hypothetical protein BCR35DRAFT_314410 [Leucosporidium creatinivorum]|uniref:Uncharacterized protein n=1 Tax=Leucosporidium creatinivorum TaxID=106004 RepID=A0A1Y2EZ19_9BASI|nr:hypothetical protein BCR35DRAFT_314410 [Leucosporidium creatinivorum]